jgi:hypothetical protein
MMAFTLGDELAMKRAKAAALEKIHVALQRPGFDTNDEDQCRALFEEIVQGLSEDEKQAIAYEGLVQLARDEGAQLVPLRLPVEDGGA